MDTGIERRDEFPTATSFAVGFNAVRRWAQRLGPYLLIEAVMPGGTLVALLLYLWRARKLDLRGRSTVGNSVTICR